MLIFFSHFAIYHHGQLLQQILSLEHVQQIVVVDVSVLVNELTNSFAKSQHDGGEVGGCLLSRTKFDDFGLEVGAVLWVGPSFVEILYFVDEASVGGSAGK